MNESPRLDDLYHMVACIYGERNAERSATATFAHFVEACGMLTVHDRSKPRGEITVEDALCKALGWYFPLLAKFRISSVEELIFRKFPYCCPYCRLEQHQDFICKNVRGEARTVNKEALEQKYLQNAHLRPKSLDAWQAMFGRIYERRVDDRARSTLGLFEELGELAEAIRVFDRYPKYLAGEAADVFSYLMGVANEHALRRAQTGEPEFSFETEFLKRYPGLCVQCGYYVCLCPPIPQATIGRLSKEMEVSKSLFERDEIKSESIGRRISEEVVSSVGGYSALAKQFPLDRGEANRALVFLCFQVANEIEASDSNLAERLREAAALANSSAASAGTRGRSPALVKVVAALQDAWPLISPETFDDAKSLTAAIGRLVRLDACKFGIVTALPKEFAAMRALLDEPREWPAANDPNDYVIGTIPARDGSGYHAVVLTLLKSPRNNSAAAAVTHLIRSVPSVTEILMVGIAGGVPYPEKVDSHVRLGDVVVTDKEGILQYDNLSVGINSIAIRSSAATPSSLLVGRANILKADNYEGKRPWMPYIVRAQKALQYSDRPGTEKDKLTFWAETPVSVEHPEDSTRQPGEPKVHLGRIGASNALLKNPHIRDLLKDEKVLAVEMEGSGIADGTWISGRNFLVVRGICDYCDPNKGDDWQAYAAVAAAAYARSLIESVPTRTF